MWQQPYNALTSHVQRFIFLPDSNQISTSTIFIKVPMRYLGNPPSESYAQTRGKAGGRADKTKLTNGFLDYGNAPKKKF